MSEGSLTFPEGITIVFADDGPTQRMQSDFHSTPRTNEFGYGAYYHIGFWSTGPHLLQGSKPQRIRKQFDRILAKGDTDYAVINVCNVREHVLGIQAATEIMNDRDGWSEAAAAGPNHDTVSDHEPALRSRYPSGGPPDCVFHHRYRRIG